MIYLSVSPDIPRFHWEIETYINNFISVGINPNKIEVVMLYDGENPSNAGLALQQKYPSVRFFFYKDDRDDKSYIPSKKPYGVYQHMLVYKDLNKEAIFYHDSDIVFVQKINEGMLERGEVWYTSDTDGYIAYDYVHGRGKEQYYQMCEIIGVDPNLIKHLDGGGAQYIIKNTNASYWLKVYEDSNKLWHFFEKQKAEGKDGDLQLWTAEMWATLWVGYQFGYRIKNHKELNFAMSTDPLSVLDKGDIKIVHNNGITGEMSGNYFFKGEFVNKRPVESNLKEYKTNLCNTFYLNEVKKYVK